MNKINTIVTSSLIVWVLMGLVTLVGCKKDDPKPETERIKELLRTNTWRIQSVTVDGTDQSTLFTGLTLTFTDTNYSTTNGGVVWPASGSWSFVDNTAKKIIRSDGLEIRVEEVTGTSLKLGLTRTAGSLGTGRIESVAGNHTFSFIK